jgi:hypothetical protein
VFGAEKRKTTEDLSTLCSGCYARVRRGVICQQITAAGAIHIVDSFAGETQESGKNFLNNWSMRRIMNG